MEPRHELIQLAISASPLLVAVSVMIWSPSTQTWLRLKGTLGAALLFLPVWFIRSVSVSCTDLHRICAPGETLIRLNPPYWGIGFWDCEQCVGNISAVFVELNSWRPALVVFFMVLTVLAACVVLRQCWRASSRFV